MSHPCDPLRSRILTILLLGTFPFFDLAATGSPPGDPDGDSHAASALSDELASLVEPGAAEPLALAAADFDEDGVPDLAVGYGDGNRGLIALHRGNVNAIYPRPGSAPGDPFPYPARVFAVPQRAEYLGSGDFDADGHSDLALASERGGALHLLRGDGRGSFAEAESIALPGALTAMAVGEVNRRDGLADVVVAIDGRNGPQLLVFEWPEGALRGDPERIALDERVESIGFGWAIDAGFRDITLATAGEGWLIRGRDRRLTSSAFARAAVAAPVVEAWTAGSMPPRLPPALARESLSNRAVQAWVAMRLNRDALPDYVAIVEGETAPRLVMSGTSAVFTVDSTGDAGDLSSADGVCDIDDNTGDGPCTLRAAIEQANASPGADAVEFHIAGPGPHTIQPATALPAIVEALTLDGFTQPGASANTIPFPGALDSVLSIEIDGSGVPPDHNGLTVTADNCAIRGLVINRFVAAGVSYGNGVDLAGSSHGVIEGNFVGSDPGGTLGRPNQRGVRVYFGSDNVIGGAAPAARNLISSNVDSDVYVHGDGNRVEGNLIGMNRDGVSSNYYGGNGVFFYIGSSNSVGGAGAGAGNLVSAHAGPGILAYTAGSLIQGNLVGTDITGTVAFANGSGVYLQNGAGSQIGGTVAGAGNLISGNYQAGVMLDSAPGARVLGNRIGTAVDGASFLGNGLSGVLVYTSGATGIEIGSEVTGSGNVIAHNGWGGWPCNGVDVAFGASTGTSILGNSIFATAPNCLGIDLGFDGPTPNDPGDVDSGANNLQNFPVLTAVTAGGATVHGSLDSTPGTEFRVELFANASCNGLGHGDGATLLGATTVTTDAAGFAAFAAAVTNPVPIGSFVTATATDPGGNTSELSACLEYTVDCDLTVSKDDGVTAVMPGGQVTYTIVAANAGPDDVRGAHVSDSFGDFLSCSWTCVPAGGATCAPGPSTEHIEDVIYLPVGATATYTVVCDVDHTGTGTLENTVWIIAPDNANDPDGENNSATDSDTLLELDYGDAPDPGHPTLWTSNGARHFLGGGLFLGASVDGDADGQPTPGADGDDADGTDDEDGVVFTSAAMTGYTTTVSVTASTVGLLNAWLDLDRDGSWLGAGEQIFTDRALLAGTNSLQVSVPATAALGPTYARFRVDSAGGLTAQGLASDGEVEDHLVDIRYSALDVPETGQTTSYGAGDDGGFQVGVPWPTPRFTSHGDGTVTDRLTGLMWSQDSVNPGPAPCNPGVTRSWYLSLTYVACLNTNGFLGHHDWRLPNVVEMNSLVHFREIDHRPWWQAQGFLPMTNLTWWSSTTTPSGLAYAHSLSAFGYTSAYNKGAISGLAVWPVRGGPGGGAVRLPATGQLRCWSASYAEIPCDGTGQDGDHRAGEPWPSPRFEVAGDCVTDRLTGLMWSRDADLFGTRTWSDALDDALGLTLCGHDDWRLPTVLEMRSLWHFDKRTDPVPGSLVDWWTSVGFVNVTRFEAWSATTDARFPAVQAWSFWGQYAKGGTQDVGVWPVRGNVQSHTADLAVMVEDSADPVVPGANLVYTVTVSNLGPTPAAQVVVTGTLPAGTAFVDATGTGWSCSQGGGVVACTVATLAVGPASPVTIEVTTPWAPGSTLTFRALVDSLQDDPAGENSSAVETTVLLGYDFGDAPDPSYPTLLASDGARHLLGSGLFLGAAVDADAAGQPTVGADGDDSDGNDDEDGVSLPASLTAGASEAVLVTVSAAGQLNAWVDFNADGDWLDPGERVLTDLPVTAGVNTLAVQVPVDAAPGATFARFRLDAGGGLAPGGLAADGEVEDYAVAISPSAELGVTMSDFPDPVVDGMPLRYFVTVTNHGSLAASGVTLTVSLPTEVVFANANPGAPTCTEIGGEVTCDLGALPAGASTGVEIQANVLPGVTGMILATAGVTLDQSDPIVANNSATEATAVLTLELFSDGFESGSTSAWSATAGGG